MNIETIAAAAPTEPSAIAQGPRSLSRRPKPMPKNSAA